MVEIIADIANKNNGIITAKDANAHGINSWFLTSMVRNGTLERVERGIYMLPSAEGYDEKYFLQKKYPKCIFSYQSALYLHQLTDRIPFMEEVTVPQGYKATAVSQTAMVHFVVGNWYEIGITECRTEMGNPVYAYDMERTICDLIRNRKHQDAEVFAKALHSYIKHKDKDIWKLREYAGKFRISQKLEDIIEVIISE
ncbi:MAG: type IV toxin-antitoxin system AbiEi family antitoxin domain-containing protein [Oscillospiraceae bacterium]|nr:type IV toxin-antitoxin system AbiEi family antitoxin domain-containing protein [Oscillospiraceae bacterium]